MDPTLLGGLASGLGNALGGALGGPTASSSSLSDAVSTPFYAPSNFSVGPGYASSAGSIGSTAQDPYSSAAATAVASTGLPPGNTLLSATGSSSTFLWVAGAAVVAFVIYISIKKRIP